MLTEKKNAKMSIYLPEETRTRFKMACAFQQASMNEVLLELIDEWLDKNDPIKNIPSNSVREMKVKHEGGD